MALFCYFYLLVVGIIVDIGSVNFIIAVALIYPWDCGGMFL